MKTILTTLILILTLNLPAQIGKVAGWNYYATFSGTPQLGKKYPVLIFKPGTGEVGTDINKLVSNGPHRFILDGGNPLPGWFVISLQPPYLWPNEAQMQIRIDSLKLLFPIDTGRVNLTGLSMGGWCSSTYVSGLQNNINTVITVQGVIPDDNQPYPQLFSNFKGTGYLCLEQRLDGRGGQAIVNYINFLRPGIATFVETNFGGGGHCCWANFYGGGGLQPSKFNGLTIYEWLIGKNAFNVVSLPPVNQQTTQKPATFYNDNNFVYSHYSRPTTYVIYNVAGQAVSKGYIAPGKQKINIAYLPQGVYYFKTNFYNTYKFYKWI